jgi:hypothetical protein
MRIAPPTACYREPKKSKGKKGAPPEIPGGYIERFNIQVSV